MRSLVTTLKIISAAYWILFMLASSYIIFRGNGTILFECLLSSKYECTWVVSSATGLSLQLKLICKSCWAINLRLVGSWLMRSVLSAPVMQLLKTALWLKGVLAALISLGSLSCDKHISQSKQFGWVRRDTRFWYTYALSNLKFIFGELFLKSRSHYSECCDFGIRSITRVTEFLACGGEICGTMIKGRLPVRNLGTERCRITSSGAYPSEWQGRLVIYA